MGDVSCIYWFSGTGNSLYAAKKLSEELGGPPLERITEKPPSGAVGGAGSKIGFVFPSYYGNLPRAVRSFIEKLEISPDTYIFCVVTMGGLGQGSIAVLDLALKAKGCHLSYGKGIMMPANYILKYNPADPAKSVAAMKKADKRLKRIACDISEKARVVKKLPVTANNLYINVAELDVGFQATKDCTGCGLCQRICPVANIRLQDGKPVWLNACEHCVACISWCPARAIEYENSTQTRRRYRNLQIQVDELTRQE